MNEELINYVHEHLSESLKIIQTTGRKQVLHNINDFQKAIIYKYTDDGYEEINDQLRLQKPIPQLGKLLIDSLQPLDEYKGLCYRSIKCSKLHLEKYAKAFAEDSVITEPSFLSCSKTKNLAYLFSSSPMFVIYSKKGRDVELIAKYGHFSKQNEKEILFLPNTQFKVLDYQELTDGSIEIILDEL
jgi:hypothetical protein